MLTQEAPRAAHRRQTLQGVIVITLRQRAVAPALAHGNDVAIGVALDPEVQTQAIQASFKPQGQVLPFAFTRIRLTRE